jgi:glycosyltransferase involved in cell wall biosynthesis
MLRGLRENGVQVDECHRDIWSGIEDKSQIRTWYRKIFLLFLWLISYPKLLFRYMRMERHDCVVVGYLGHLDVIVLWLFAKLRRTPIVWDAFISLYDTVVDDRKFLSRSHPAARVLHSFEKLACKAADLIILDTAAHAGYFIKEYGIPSKKCVAVFVGAESDQFPVVHEKRGRESYDVESPLNVLFYGQFIPLHGIETIIKAATILKEHSGFKWTLIGSGQETEKIEKMLIDVPLPFLKWLKWVEYSDLKQHIAGADVCLGIFGNSGKAGRVIPNKVYQIVSSGKTLITRDSDAIRELACEHTSGVLLVPAANPQALAEALLFMHTHREVMNAEPHFTELRKYITPMGIGGSLVCHLNALTNQHGRKGV